MYKKIINHNSGIYLNYDYLMFPVNLNIISKINIGTDVFFSKTNYHVSLICLEGFSESEQLKILSFSKKYLLNLKISKIYRLAIKDNLKSIIVRVKLTGLRKLIIELNRHFGYDFVVPPTHITLFTPKNQFGIGLDTLKEYATYTHQISQKDCQKISKSFQQIYS